MKRFLSAVGSLLGLVVFVILVFSITANWNTQAPTSVSYGYPGPEPIKSSSQPTAYPGPSTDSPIDQKVNQAPPLPLTPILEESTEPTVDPGSSSSGAIQGEIRLVDQQEIILKGELGKIQGLYEPDSDGNTLVGKAIFEEGVAILKIDLETGAAKLLTPIISQGIEAITMSGNYVAWVEALSTENNFYTQLIVFDMVKEEQFVLAKGLPRHPDIKDDILAWQEYRDGQWTIYSYDLAHAQQFTITKGADLNFFPQVCSKEWLIYLRNVKEGQTGSADLIASNLITNEEITIGQVPFPRNAIPGRHHACDGNRVAWIGMTAAQNNEANFEQHIYDLNTRTDNILNVPIQGLSFDVSISGDILISTTGYDLSQDVLFDPFSNLSTENTNGKLLFSDKRMIWIAEPYDQPWQLYTASIVYEIDQTRIAQQEIAPTPTPELGVLPKTSIYYEINLPRRVLVENIWQGYVNSYLTRIYAGRLLPDNMTGDMKETYQGAIYVTKEFPNGDIEHSLHTTKDETGALSIVDVRKTGRMILISAGFQTKGSEEFFFDVPALQFTSSLEEVVPEKTPISDETPEAYP